MSKNVLVVGASQGIGFAVAERYAQSGCGVAITGRNEADLNAAADRLRAHGGAVVVHRGDATSAEDAVRCVDETVADLGNIDVCLMNVGGAQPASAASASVDDILWTMRLNYDTLVNFFVPVTRHMRERGGGVFAHTNSIAGHAGMPLSAHYSAGKAAGRVFLEGARIELREHGVKVVTLCPGFVATRAHEKGDVPTPFIMTPEVAAQKMVRAIEAERREVSFPFPLAFGSWVGRVMPKFLVEAIMAKATPKLPES